jgi:hypothetical protein
MWLALALSAALASAVVLKPVANMYAKPDALAPVVSQALLGTTVNVIERTEGWARVETPDRYSGWMPLASLRLVREGDPAYPGSGLVAQVASLFANLYREPDVTSHEPLIIVAFETRLMVSSEPARSDRVRWFGVTLPDGRHAWIARGDVTFDPPQLAIADLPVFARRFLGLPYLWGGTSTFGYDCSGFVQMLYRRAGVPLPRDAQPQADWPGLVPVDRKDLRPGDLVYFGSSDRHITHTGMWIGGGEFISATVHEHPVVRIDRLDDPHWAPLFVAARRLK